MLKDIFISLATKYSNNTEYITSLWNEIEKKHSKSNRHYHNLSHLYHLYSNLNQVKNDIEDWDIILFALFYHDFIYNVHKHNNEEKSAKKALKTLQELSTNKQRATLCSDIILATKGHNISAKKDINYFTDADLSILGSDWRSYQTYFENIRKEYKYYPDFMYNKGRIKILHHFISMPKIFKTDYFYTRFESQAKENITNEINLLTK
ncbi:hypothetical protein [Aquimarina sp. I32.4]|uniref:HD domain-containing protein n=1 Tax=Aquimarina sp. I32.4 TaxID=2053903 RepID=UPI000CDF2430|nr:hypothetical protein [Aquimarina sp. I32.4]